MTTSQRLRLLGFVCLMLSAMPGLSADGAAHGMRQATSSADDWPAHGRDWLEQRFSPLTQINGGNVATLGLAWFLDLDDNRGEEATPLVIDGILYTTTSWSKVMAIEAATGRVIWKYDPHVPGRAAYKGCCDVVNRGVAFYEGRIFFGTMDGRLIALDAVTGKPVWSVMTVDAAKPYTISGAPRIAKGRVIIGNSGADLGVRGYVTAYEAKTGKQAWRFYTVPGDPSAPADGAASDQALAKLAANTWSGPFWKTGGGGTAWDSIVYDADLNQVYIGVGNGSPWNPRARTEGKGDNLFLSSIVAVDADTGRYRWHYQETPQEAWDFTATQPMILATLPIGGQSRRVILQAPKNGFFYVIDRRTGRLISAEKYVPANWASRIDPATGRPVENPLARYRDEPFLMTVGGAGGHNWQPMSFSPRTNLVYLPAQEVPMMYENDEEYHYTPGGLNNGIERNYAPIPAGAAERTAIAASLKGRLLAWDPVQQRKAWSVEYSGPWNGGTLATAGGLVFAGNAQGMFAAYDDATGAQRWSFDAQSGIMAGPVSFAVNGRQYVAVLSGYGGAVGLALPEFGGSKLRPPGRVLVFTLGGSAQLPAFDATPPPANPPADVWDQATIHRGDNLYAFHCSRCHAVGLLSAGVVPDLRRSSALSDAAAWRRIVIDGVLEPHGMVSFRAILSPGEAESIRAYVGSEARALERETAEGARP